MTTVDHEETNETTDAVVRQLNANDRCDACGAQAYVRVTLATGELYFCAHHANANKAKLEPLAKEWHDESDKLLAR